jgi:PAS domain S-box-containing protein
MKQANTSLWQGLFSEQQDLGLVIGALTAFPQPVLLLEAVRQEIVFANAPFLELTAFSFDEVVRHKVSDVLLNVSEDGLRPGMETRLSIQRRKRAAVALDCETYALDLKEQWLLVVFRLLNMPMQGAVEHWFEGLLGLEHLYDAGESDFLRMALCNIQQLFDTEIACIYLMDDKLPVLHKVVSSSDALFFPETIPSTDLIRLSGSLIWTPGRRVFNEIHRAGRLSDLEYVASKSLGDLPDSMGLLVVGGFAKPSNNWLKGMLDFCGLAVLNGLRMRRDRLNMQNRVNAERLKQRLNEQVLESMEDGVVIVSPELRIVSLNPAAEWLLGYVSDEVVQQRVENILIGPDRMVPALELACQGVATHNLGNGILHRRNGVAFPARIEVIPVMNDGQVLAILIFISDQSEEEQNRQRSQQLEHRAVLGEFTAVFAHEVRNPINNISTGLQLLASRLPAGDANMNVINRMMGDCLRLSHLMESVLSFSRAITPTIEAMDLRLFLQRLVDRWRPTMARNNVELVFYADDNLLPVGGDARLLEQVFTNLISNAIDAMKTTDGGTLGVRLQMVCEDAQRQQVKVIISDTGPGIPSDILPHLFEPFVTTKPQGTGLGLSICKRIVTVHEGTMTTETFPGGTIFSVYLPIYQGGGK